MKLPFKVDIPMLHEKLKTSMCDLYDEEKEILCLSRTPFVIQTFGVRITSLLSCLRKQGSHRQITHFSSKVERNKKIFKLIYCMND